MGGRLRFLTAGESHGPSLTGVLEGMPAGVPLVTIDGDPERSHTLVTVDQAAGARPVRLAYALVPHADASRMRSYAKGPLRVLANSRRVQAVAHRGLGLTAVNTFAPGRHDVEAVRVDGPSSLLVRRSPDSALTSVAVSDPTMRRDTVSVLLRGRRLRPVTADEGVRVRAVSGGTRIDVTTHHAYGRSFTVTLRVPH